MSTDDDADLSTSSRDYLESPGKAKMKALQQKLQKQGVSNAGDKQGDLQALKLSLLRGQVDPKKQDATKEPEKQSASGTLTREQEIQASKLTADAKPTAEKLATQSKQDAKAVEELKQDEVQGEDA